MSDKALIVIGGSSVKKDNIGTIYAKGSFYAYLEGMSKKFNNLIWIVPLSSLNEVKKKVIKKNIRVIVFSNNFFSILKVLFFLISFSIKKNKIYSIMFPTPYLFFASMLLRFISQKFIFYLGVDYKLIISLYRSKFKKFLIKLVYEIPIRMSDAVLVRGNKVAKTIECLNKTIYHSAPIANIAHTKNIKKNFKIKGNFNIIFIGKLIPEKGFLDLIQANKIILNKHKGININIDVIGDGPLLKKFKSKTSNINYHGWIDSYSKIEKLLKNASIFLFLSRENYPEGLPRVIEEAQSFGVPICATNISAINKENFEDSIILTKPSNPENLVQNILLLYKSPEIRKNLSLAGLKYFRQKYKFNVVDQHYKILNDQI